MDTPTSPTNPGFWKHQQKGNNSNCIAKNLMKKKISLSQLVNNIDDIVGVPPVRVRTLSKKSETGN
jgi:hypothetical protein